MKEICMNCSYWQGDPSTWNSDAENSEYSLVHLAECRFGPPNLFTNSYGFEKSVWPRPTQNDWCAQWKARDKCTDTEHS